MADYLFRSRDGDVIERDMTRDALMDLPLSPDGRLYVIHEGQRYFRINAMPGSVGLHLDAGLAEKCRGYPMVSHAAERNSGGDLGLEHVKEGRHKGKVIFRNPQEKREYCRQMGYVPTKEFSDRDFEHASPARGLPMPKAPWQ